MVRCRDKNNNQQFEQEQQQTAGDGKEKLARSSRSHLPYKPRARYHHGVG
jgi:hypothetical protein